MYPAILLLAYFVVFKCLQGNAESFQLIPDSFRWSVKAEIFYAREKINMMNEHTGECIVFKL